MEHKHQVASSVQGYLPDGSTAYGDGRVVSRNERHVLVFACVEHQHGAARIVTA